MATAEACAERAAWTACVASSAILLLMLWCTGTTLDATAVAVASVLAGVPAGLHVFYARLRRDARIASVCGGLAVLNWSSFASAFAALAALRSGVALVDPILARADAALGVDTQSFVVWASRMPSFGHLLAFAYGATVPAVFAVVLFLGATGRTERMWESAFAFAAGASFCAFALAFVPAAAAFQHFGTPEAVLERLPSAAGRFHLKTLEAFRSGAVDHIHLMHIEGVATFPSFHATMATIVAFGLRGIATLFIPACGLAILIMLATIVIGGHYAVDVPAGVALYGACRVALRHRISGGAAARAAT
jgi:membrane-associated phospholipid phosphatase